MAAATPVWISLMAFYVEEDKGHMMDERMFCQKVRSAVRGCVASFHDGSAARGGGPRGRAPGSAWRQRRRAVSGVGKREQARPSKAERQQKNKFAACVRHHGEGGGAAGFGSARGRANRLVEAVDAGR